MAWSEPQRAMLQEMGVWPGWPAAANASPSFGLRARMQPSHEPAVSGPTQALAAIKTQRPAPSPVLEPVSKSVPLPVPVPAQLSAQALRVQAHPVTPAVLAPVHPAPDWASLQQAVVACEACGLCKTRTQTVFGVGHRQAHWMVVGEAPGQHEDEQGEPFVGAAGQLLDAMLRALGLTREAEGEPAQRVYIANTLKCRPPGNRNPQPQELAQCEPFLLRQLELVRPRIVLAMGRFAVQSLLRTGEPIGKLRGRVHQIQGVPLVVTYHPAYLLRNLSEKARAWEDLSLAAEHLRGNEGLA